ncbi:MAG: 50S ribosomal protein L29 [Myxococcales bacterium]|nr:50S ribosomal protein L29 [Myxococcales bacterium]MDD9966093.1 50S ribosomal protein L29 [Myxococcales bacterium]
MKTQELREKTDSELEELERDARRELWKARFDNYTNQLDNTAKIRRLRRQVARVRTLMTERSNANEE